MNPCNPHCEGPISVSIDISIIRELIRTQNASGLLISKQSNFSWITGGFENRVRDATDLGSGSILITQDRIYLLTNNIERPRLMEEELSSFPCEILEYNWYDSAAKKSLIQDVCGNAPLLSDTGEDGTVCIENQLAQYRITLDANEKEALRGLGKDAADIMFESVGRINPGMRETDIAAQVSFQSRLKGAFPVVVMVGTDQRIYQYRHPLPTGKPLKRHLMIVLCVRRRGLILSCSRLLHFGAPPQEIMKKHKAVCTVDSVFISETRPGAVVSDIFTKACEAYSKTGYPGEWKHHHQGGACGYEPREYLATPDNHTAVSCDQAFAWNPSIAGTKSEDTILVETNENSILSADSRWPSIDIDVNGKVISRPDILVV